ncbi:MAG: Asp-tRNA(Asn)/Glu-tRNA(Gln) amidotransferase subunit GatC [Cellvibrionaceae bacterium]
MDRSELEQLASLARLNVDDKVFDEVTKSISDILVLVDQLQSIDTTGVDTMAHPQDALQRLRVDNVTEPNVRDKFQAIAPLTENGLYLVPKVID